MPRGRGQEVSAEQRLTYIDEVKAMLDSGMTISAASREIGIPRSTVNQWLIDAGLHQTNAGGKHQSKPPPMTGGDHPSIPESDVIQPGVYCFSVAQNNTAIHERFFPNILAYAEHRNAKVMIGRIAYDAANYRAADVVSGYRKDRPAFGYHKDLEPYLCSEIVHLAPTLVFDSKINISPTMQNPLAGLDPTPPHASSIIPHPRVAMKSVGRYGMDSIFRMTTGTVTKHNLIGRRLGSISEFHHTYAFLVVEVDEMGDWWARQVIADSETGSFQDLDVRVSRGRVTTGNRIAGLVAGDIHVRHLDQNVDHALFGKGGIADKLKPRTIVLHDIFDGESISHYTHRDIGKRIQTKVAGRLSLADELLECAAWIERMAEVHDAKFVVAPSNHDERLTSIINGWDWRRLSDPRDMKVYLNLAHEYVHTAETDPRQLNALDVAMRQYDIPDNVEFLRYGDSHYIEGIQVAMHGHIGAAGSRGSVNQYSRTGEKSMSAHSHVATIKDGAWSVGTSTDLDLDYAVRGPSAWSHTCGLIYDGGKRALVNIHGDGSWRMG